MKYYFITYQATNRQGSISIWNEVIDTSPMAYIKYVEKIEQQGTNTYHIFVVINTCEISESEYLQFKGQF